MGLIGQFLGMLFGSGRNVMVETAQVFRENAEAAGQRQAELSAGVLGQFAAEFGPRPKGGFDRFMDGLNRVPRPAMALGALGMIAAALVDPVWFAARMQGLALVPEPLWWLLGAVVSFYFGARSQTKGHEFQASIAQTMAHAPAVAQNIAALETLRRSRPVLAERGKDKAQGDDGPTRTSTSPVAVNADTGADAGTDAGTGTGTGTVSSPDAIAGPVVEGGAADASAGPLPARGQVVSASDNAALAAWQDSLQT